MNSPPIPPREFRVPQSQLSKTVIGWQEAVLLPDLTPLMVVAKIDTGAVLSSLNARDIRYSLVADQRLVSFQLSHSSGWCASGGLITVPLQGFSTIRSSNGSLENRPVISTQLRIGAVRRQIKLTLSDRNMMQFALLLGRDAVQDHFIVDCSECFLVTKFEN